MKVNAEDIAQKAQEMRKSGFDYLVKITAIDYVQSITVIYFLRDIGGNRDDIIEADLDCKDAWVPTIIDIFPCADWYERELSEMFGIQIRGRAARRLLLEKWDGTEPPFRKSFAWNSEYKAEG